MDKEELLKEITKTEEHLATMKKLLEDCEYSKWKPKPNEEYYCVDDGNDVRRVKFTIMSAYDRDRIKAYNCFKTREQAETEAEKILVRRMLEDIARRLNRGRKIDWFNDRKIDWYNQEQDKYFIRFSYWEDRIRLETCWKNKVQGVIYCLDKKFLDVALKEIGEERLREYLKGE